LHFFPKTQGSSCWLSGIVLHDHYDIKSTRRIVSQLKEKGIECRMFWKPVHLQTPYRGMIYEDNGVVDSLWGRILTLPCSTNLTEEQFTYVVETVRDLLSII